MRDYGFSPAQQDEIWRRWRAGQSFSVIGRALGAPMQHARRFLYQLRRTLTWDRGRVMAERQAITAETGMPIYLCKPRSLWQRGTNENTDRLLRQYLPKGSDLRTFSQADLDAIAHELNHRPRKTHGYRTSAEVYADLLNSGDALTA